MSKITQEELNNVKIEAKTETQERETVKRASTVYTKEFVQRRYRFPNIP